MLALLLVGCGGGSEDSDVLHLREYNATEDQYRTFIRLEVASPLSCGGVRGLSAEEFLALVEAAEDNENDEWPGYAERVGLEHVPGQRPDRDSMLWAAEIVLEECERITS